MPTYADMIRFEGSVPPNTIRLVKSGNFYRAYDHSAWLFHSCIAEHKVMRKYLKALHRDIYYLGFPEKSLFNNIGEHRSSKTEYGFDIELDPSEVPDASGFEAWKASVATEPASKGDFNSLPLTGAEAEKEVLKRLREFPLENRTMIECAVFLAELRKILNAK